MNENNDLDVLDRQADSRPRPDGPVRDGMRWSTATSLYAPSESRAGAQGLTAKQRIYVEAYVESGGKNAVACRAAGMHPSGGKALRNGAAIQQAMHAYRESILRTRGGSVGLAVLLELAEDQSTPYVIRHRAARDLLDLAGHMKTPANQPLSGIADRPLTELSLAELEAFVSAGKTGLESLKNQRLRTIEGEAVRCPADSDTAQDSAQQGGEDDFFA